MPFHQRVDNEARLTRMIEDLGITINTEKPRKEKQDSDPKEKNKENEKN